MEKAKNVLVMGHLRIVKRSATLPVQQVSIVQLEDCDDLQELRNKVSISAPVSFSSQKSPCSF